MRKDGTHFLAEVVLTAIYNKTGTLSGFAKVTRDITESKLAEQQLERSRGRLDAILNSSLDGIVVLGKLPAAPSAEGIIELVPAGGRQTWGWSGGKFYRNNRAQAF